MTFLHKRVREGDTSFGSDLRDLRELHGVTFDEACRATRIDRNMLRAFESDRIEDIDDPIFAERHLLAYVRYLGGYEPYFRMRYAERLAALSSTRKTEDLLPRTRKIGFLDLFAAPQFLAFLGVLFIAALLGGYVIWQARAVNVPPTLEIERPRDGELLDRPRVTIRGQTIAEATVTVNGQDAPVSPDGSFHLELDVPRGTSVIAIVSKRRRGSETRVERRVIFERELQVDDWEGMTTATGTEAVPTSTR